MELKLYITYQQKPTKMIKTSLKELLLGRPGHDIIVHVDLMPDRQVSRPHARLWYEWNAWWISDVGSKRGTLLNGGVVTDDRKQVQPADIIQIGESLIRVEFEPETLAEQQEPDSGDTVLTVPVNEVEPPVSIAEHERLSLFSKIHRIAGLTSGNTLHMLEGFLDILIEAFPRTQHRTILLIEDDGKNLVPRAYFPKERSYISFTLARQVIRSHQAVMWRRDLSPTKAVSLYDTTYAIYAPMLVNDRVIGVIHLDTTLPEEVFDRHDVELLSVIATTMAMCLEIDGQQNMTMLPSIFVSYSRKNLEFVQRLAADLRRQRVKVWFDERLELGGNWRDELADAIRTADGFVLIASPHAAESEYVLWEISIALNRHKKIFPLMLERCELPDTIAHLNWKSVDSTEQYHLSVDKLVDQLFELKRGTV